MTVRSTPEPNSYVQVQNPRTTRIVGIRQPSSPVVVDVSTPPLTTNKTTRVINDNTHETFVDDRRSLVDYQNYYSTRPRSRRLDWCAGCDCCRTSPFVKRKDVASYRTRITKDGRRVRYRVSSKIYFQNFCFDF